MHQFPVRGAGLGFKRQFIEPFLESPPSCVDFFEIAPENWINVGGKRGLHFRQFTEQYPFIAHGLSLSLGGPAPLDLQLVSDIKNLIKTHHLRLYSEHLSFCSDDGHLYDLLPMPFTEEAVHHIAGRIRQVQDILGQQIAVENASYYASPYQEMGEIEFINAVIAEADCLMLLDVNNIYVNSINHQYNAMEFLKAMPGHRVSYIHVAGHYQEAPDLLIDTHGAEVIPSVWALLEKAYELFGVIPTMVERDNDIPPMPVLLGEVEHIAKLQQKWSAHERVTAIAS